MSAAYWDNKIYKIFYFLTDSFFYCFALPTENICIKEIKK